MPWQDQSFAHRQGRIGLMLDKEKEKQRAFMSDSA